MPVLQAVRNGRTGPDRDMRMLAHEKQKERVGIAPGGGYWKQFRPSDFRGETASPQLPPLTAPASEAGLLVGSLKPPHRCLTPRLRAIPRPSHLPKRHYREPSVQKHSGFLTRAGSEWTGSNQLAARPVSRRDVSSNAPDSGTAFRKRVRVIQKALSGSCWRVSARWPNNYSPSMCITRSALFTP